MKITHRRTRKTRRMRRRGAVLVLMAAMSVVLLGMTAFAVDLGWIVTNKTQAQSAADAAALAGASTLVEGRSLASVRSEAQQYAAWNAPAAFSTVSFGTWDPATKTFTADEYEPNAVRVVVERTEAKGNSAPLFFAKVFGRDHFDITAESIAVGAIPAASSFGHAKSVYVTSTKDLSNVVLDFGDGVHQKFEGLSGYSGTFMGTGVHEGKTILGVWIKSGAYQSGHGPGYGEYIAFSPEATVVHGNIAAKGSYAHVTASFDATGVDFTESGSSSPVRLVK